MKLRRSPQTGDLRDYLRATNGQGISVHKSRSMSVSVAFLLSELHHRYRYIKHFHVSFGLVRNASPIPIRCRKGQVLRGSPPHAHGVPGSGARIWSSAISAHVETAITVAGSINVRAGDEFPSITSRLESALYPRTQSLRCLSSRRKETGLQET